MKNRLHDRLLADVLDQLKDFNCDFRHVRADMYEADGDRMVKIGEHLNVPLLLEQLFHEATVIDLYRDEACGAEPVDITDCIKIRLRGY